MSRRLNLSSLLSATLALLAIASGCATKPIPSQHAKFMVAIDSEGFLRDTNGRRIQNSQKEAQAQMSQDYLTNIFSPTNQELAQHTNILLYIQGGLYNYEDAARRAQYLGDLILRDTNRPAYPIFIGWDANLFSAWFEHYYSVHRGRTESTSALLLSPFTLLSDSARLVSHAPIAMLEQMASGRRTYQTAQLGPASHGATDHRPKWIRDINEQYARLRGAGMDVALAESERTNEFRHSGAQMIANAGPKIIWEAAVDSAGKTGWDHMLRRTKTMFTQAGASKFGEGGMEIFAQQLTNYVGTHPNITVTIIGHSMGTIVANELIRRHGDNLRLSEIVYMAAACGVEDFDRNVVPYLRGHTNVQFFNLCLHPANDSAESYGYLFPALSFISPQGSLLEWIDRYYSSTETDYGRTLGKWENAILGTRGFIERPGQDHLKDQIHLKGFGAGPEINYGPQHHGDFDQMRFWDPIFWKPGVWSPTLLHRWPADSARK